MRQQVQSRRHRWQGGLRGDGQGRRGALLLDVTTTNGVIKIPFNECSVPSGILGFVASVVHVLYNSSSQLLLWFSIANVMTLWAKCGPAGQSLTTMVKCIFMLDPQLHDCYNWTQIQKDVPFIFWCLSLYVFDLLVIAIVPFHHPWLLLVWGHA